MFKSDALMQHHVRHTNTSVSTASADHCRTLPGVASYTGSGLIACVFVRHHTAVTEADSRCTAAHYPLDFFGERLQ